LFRSLIIGIDPGAVTGIAVLTLKGRLLAVLSKRGLRKGDVIRQVIQFGTPLIIATDVNPPPKTVEKVAVALGSRLWYPARSLSGTEKSKLLRDHPEVATDTHQRDALAAALAAHKSYGELLARVAQSLKKRKLSELYEQVAARLIVGTSGNISEAIEQVLGERKRPEEKMKRLRRDYELLQRRLAARETQIGQLRRHVARLEAQLESARRRMARAGLAGRTRLKRELTQLRQEVKMLRQANRLLRGLKRAEARGFEPLLKIDRLELSSLKQLNELIGLAGRVVWIRQVKNVPLLNRFGIRAAVLTVSPPRAGLGGIEFPVLCLKTGQIQNFEGLPVLPRDEFEQELGRAREVSFREWVKAYRKRHA
jgi:hypothetical protein